MYTSYWEHCAIIGEVMSYSKAYMYTNSTSANREGKRKPQNVKRKIEEAD